MKTRIKSLLSVLLAFAVLASCLTFAACEIGDDTETDAGNVTTDADTPTQNDADRSVGSGPADTQTPAGSGEGSTDASGTEKPDGAGTAEPDSPATQSPETQSPENKDPAQPKDGVTKLSFKSAVSYDYLKSLDGTTVQINGYLATSSPVDGSFIFLMNMPYQSCPFCKPNTSQLSNTMEVYPKAGKTFEYTNQAVCVTGTLKVAPTEADCFTDPYGYEFNFKIVDAKYTILKAEDLEGDTALWQKIAESNLIVDLNAMYEYVNFVCMWNTYFVNSYQLPDGSIQPGYYLYSADAWNYLTQDGAQWNYGYRDGYFEGLLSRIREIDGGSGVLSSLTANVTSAKELAEYAISQLVNGEYTYQEQYVEKFGTTDFIYTLNNGAELESRINACWMEFSTWLASWEM